MNSRLSYTAAQPVHCTTLGVSIHIDVDGNGVLWILAMHSTAQTWRDKTSWHQAIGFNLGRTSIFTSQRSFGKECCCHSLSHHTIPVITQCDNNSGSKAYGTILLFCPNHFGTRAMPLQPMLCPSIHIYSRFHSTQMALQLIYTVPNWPFQMCPTAQGEWGKFTARNQKYATLWNMGFFMAWFELHIRNCGVVQWLFTIWGRGKAVERPSGAIFHSPIRRSYRWLKALWAAATAGPAGHILEK